MSELIQERIQQNLQRLRLGRIEEILTPVNQQAESDKISYLNFLDSSSG